MPPEREREKEREREREMVIGERKREMKIDGARSNGGRR